jgi:hypothetical protein
LQNKYAFARKLVERRTAEERSGERPLPGLSSHGSRRKRFVVKRPALG